MNFEYKINQYLSKLIFPAIIEGMRKKGIIITTDDLFSIINSTQSPNSTNNANISPNPIQSPNRIQSTKHITLLISPNHIQPPNPIQSPNAINNTDMSQNHIAIPSSSNGTEITINPIINRRIHVNPVNSVANIPPNKQGGINKSILTNKVMGKCSYQFTKGAVKGMFCGKPTMGHELYCDSCVKNRKTITKNILTTPINSTPNFPESLVDCLSNPEPITSISNNAISEPITSISNNPISNNAISKPITPISNNPISNDAIFKTIIDPDLVMKDTFSKNVSQQTVNFKKISNYAIDVSVQNSIPNEVINERISESSNNNDKFKLCPFDAENDMYRETTHNFIVKPGKDNSFEVMGQLTNDTIFPLSYAERCTARSLGFVVIQSEQDSFL